MKTERTASFFPLSAVEGIPRTIVDKDRTERLKKRRALLQRQAERILEEQKDR